MDGRDLTLIIVRAHGTLVFLAGRLFCLTLSLLNDFLQLVLEERATIDLAFSSFLLDARSLSLSRILSR